MILSDLAALGSFISGLAVVVSLVYLSVQTRQNSKHTQALISQGRTNQVIDFNQSVSTDRELADIMLRGWLADPTLPALSSVELYRFSLSMFSGFLTAEDDYRQHQGGLIEGALVILINLRG